MDAPTCAVCGSSTVFERDKPYRILCPLHVAAPELLAACRGLIQVIQELGECSRPEYHVAWEAMTKAEGKV